nr:ninja-family protein mc410 [Ipomoea trifida]
MEDENGLNLSLGLPCGGGTASQKGKTGSSSNFRAEEGDRDSKLINDFKNFLDGGTQKHDSVIGLHRSDLVKNEGSFFNDLSSTAVNVDAAKKLNSGGFWGANSGRSIEVEEEKTTDAGDRHKSLFGETSHKRKRERDAHNSDLHDKTRTSHISINTDDDSTGDNGDVADSEAEGSTSRQVSQPDDSSKRRVGSSGQIEINKEVHGVSDSGNAELSGQRRFSISSEKEVKFGNMSYGVPFSQPINIVNMPYSLPSKDTNPSGTVGAPNYPVPGMVQMMAATGGERQGTQPLMPANMPLMFGYSPVQLSSLDKDNARVPASHLQRQQLHPSYARGPLNPDKHSEGLKITQASVPVVALKPSEFSQYDKGSGKQHAAEEGSSTRGEENVRGSNISFRGKDPSELPKPDGLPSEFPAIKPGLAADVKFGGCGSYPNLPWVSTTGSGPNGKTISGVTYRFSPTQIKIVCACHGSHMSPEEFVRHASEEHPTQDVGSGVTSFPNSNSAASAQS